MGGSFNFLTLFLCAFAMPETNKYTEKKQEEEDEEKGGEISSSPPTSPIEKFINGKIFDFFLKKNSFFLLIYSFLPLYFLFFFFSGARCLKEDALQCLLVIIYSLTSFANGALFAVFLFSLSEPAEQGGVGLTTLGAGLYFFFFDLIKNIFLSIFNFYYVYLYFLCIVLLLFSIEISKLKMIK